MTNSIEFDWIPNSENAARKTADSIVAAAGVAFGVALAMTFVLGTISSEQAARGAVAAGLLSAVSLYSLRGITRAHVTIDDRKLTLRNAAGSFEYPWSDVVGFSRRAPKSHWMLRLLHVRDSAFLEVNLARRSRLGLWRTSGTRVAGIPQFVKRLELRVRDLDGLAAEFEKHAAPRQAS